MNDVEVLREALTRIAEIADGTSRGVDTGGRDGGDTSDVDVPGCSIKALPERLQIKAARFAAQNNPANAIQMAPIGGGRGLRHHGPDADRGLDPEVLGPCHAPIDRQLPGVHAHRSPKPDSRAYEHLVDKVRHLVRPYERDGRRPHFAAGERVLVLSRYRHQVHPGEPPDHEPARIYDEHP